MRPSALIARSQPMRRLAEEVRRFASIDANALVSGETGVGKGVIALALHAGEPRRRRPFVTIDCRSLPTTLIEAELFGVERGAFYRRHSRQAQQLRGGRHRNDLSRRCG